MRNAKLWKRILFEGIGDDSHEVDGQEKFIDMVIKAPIIVDTRPFLGGFEYDWIDIKSLCTPFKQTWIECQPDSFGDYFGSMCISLSKKEMSIYYDVNEYDIPENSESCIAFCCVTAGNKNRPSVMGSVTVWLDANNYPLSPRKLSYRKSFLDGFLRAGMSQEQAGDCMDGIAFKFADLLQILSCKNVSLIQSNLEPRTSMIAAKRHGGKSDDYRYHTLIIRPAGSKGDSPTINFGIMPHHVCRGHFAEYGEEFGKGLLFGRLSGRFYIPPHLKGDKKNGVVEKDYEIKP